MMKQPNTLAKEIARERVLCDRINRAADRAIKPLPCPFCGVKPRIEPWHGGGPDKVMISCKGARCSVAPCHAGEPRSQAVREWNERKTP
jgi:hypothetical protein